MPDEQATSACTGDAQRNGTVAVAIGVLVALVFARLVAQYYFLGDDFYISLRYAQNLVEGHGLVYNPGERVEGYTNFLWVMMMAGCLKAGMSPEIVSNVIGIASGVAVLGVVAWMGAASSRWSDPLIWIAPACLAVNRTFCAWSTSGLETQFFSLLVLCGYVCFLGERRRNAAYPLGSALLLATATLTRPDGGLFFAVAGCFFAWDVLVSRRRRFRSLALWAAVYVLIVGTHVAWRYSYYGYLLPNTFYAKVSGFWWGQSKVWFWLFLRDYYLVCFAPLLPVLFLLRRDFTHVLFATVLTAYGVYMVYVGGDHFEFRFLTPVLAYLYWLLQESIREAFHRWTAWGLPGNVGLGAGIAVGALLVVASHAPNTAGFDGMRYGIADLESLAGYGTYRVEEGRFLRTLVEEGYLTGSEVIAVGGAGALPYCSRLYAVDIHGLADAAIARQKVRQRGWVFHEKVASREYLTQRRVAIWDVENRIVQRAGSPKPMPHVVEHSFYNGPVRCVEAKGRYLVFATTLPETEFRRTFSKFRIIF